MAGSDGLVNLEGNAQVWEGIYPLATLGIVVVSYNTRFGSHREMAGT